MNNDNKKMLSNEELSFVTGQIALMLSSGISTYESMEVLAENYASTFHASAFKGISETTEQGYTLAEAFERSGLFPKYAVKMVQIGEQTGKLDKVLEGLSHHYMRENNLSISVKHAVQYPMVLMVIMACVVLILNIKVLPLFSSIMMNLGGNSMKLTRITMKLGHITGIVALVLIALMLIAAGILILLVKNGKKDTVVNLLSKYIPSFGKLEKAIAAERFLSVLSISLQAGYPPENAIETCMEFIDDKDSLSRIQQIMNENSETGSMSDAICNSGFLEPLKARMVKIGFMTGKQDEVTTNVAELYSSETDAKLERLLSLVEPTLITILAVIIGCILLAIMLPLAGLMSSML